MSMAGVQAAQALCVLLLGISIGFLYDLYRLLLPFQPGQLRLLFADIIWWLLATVWAFLGLYRLTWAELRTPLLLLLLTGMALYLYYFSPVIRRPLAACLQFLKRVLKLLGRLLGRLLQLLFMPPVWLTGTLYRLLAALTGAGGRLLQRGRHRLSARRKRKKAAAEAAKAENAENPAQDAP